MAELRNPNAERWDLDRAFREHSLGPCFPRGITFADVDTETEINGHFLVVEGKRSGEALSNGQRYANLARVSDNRTVLIVWGTPPGEIEALGWFSNGRLLKEEATLEDFHDICTRWARWAAEQRRPEPRVAGFVPYVFAHEVAA